MRAKTKYWIALGFLLIMYNDPFHSMVIFTPTFFGQIFEMWFTTLFCVVLLSYFENNFYMMREDLYRRLRWLKYVKMVFYTVMFILMAVVNGIGLKRMDEEGDYGFNE